MVQFVKATKKQARLRLALFGPSGSGKTYSALKIATHLVPGGRIAVIDTERGSASKYADKFDFEVLELESFEPKKFVEAFKAAAAAGFDVIICDSLTHAWAGKGGALEQADKASMFKGENRFTAWRHVTPQHNELVDTILTSPAHVICTMRAKTEWLIEEDDRGKKVPKKKGLAPIQRDGMEYEFDVTGSLSTDGNVLTIDKTRCDELSEIQFFPKPGEELARILREWLTSGVKVDPKPVAQEPVIDWNEKLDEGLRFIDEAPADTVDMLKAYLSENFPSGKCPNEIRKRLAAALTAKLSAPQVSS